MDIAIRKNVFATDVILAKRNGLMGVAGPEMPVFSSFGSMLRTYCRAASKTSVSVR